jgi:hypothetical protein
VILIAESSKATTSEVRRESPDLIAAANVLALLVIEHAFLLSFKADALAIALQMASAIGSEVPEIAKVS